MAAISEKILKLLEFDLIRGRVAECALSAEAAQGILEERPLSDPGELGALKALVREAADRIATGDGEPRDHFPEIGFLLSKIEVEGAVLEIDEAYALGLFARAAEAFKTWLLGKEAQAGSGGERSPLRALAADLPDPSPLRREVFRVLDRDGALRDLPEFREIRDRIRRLTGELEAAAARYAAGEETRRMLQSPLPSQRDGRLVLALKANFRGRIRGIVHEVSSTGQTLFVEPAEVVEKNNEILIERRRLDAEILRVLRELTRRIAAQGEALGELHRGIIRLETLRARARYGAQGHFAREGKALALIQARHPLLGDRAVPIDLALEGGVRQVIITGPNTGGKTVTLKILGLFALMNQFGLALPSGEGTVLPLFDGVYADIGDEQSLSQSLSTFSAHMTTIAAIAAAATADSLVLLDELGSGTDPAEGSAIAMAILDHLSARGSRVIVTTHHGALKNYGSSREGVENASVEFDRRTLSPTYRILMGLPGESRALEIAARNGLPEGIVAAARSYLTGGQADVSALITTLKEKHRELAAADEAARAAAFRLREERRQADLRELRLRQKELDLRAAGVGSLRRLLGESRKTLENLVREVREGELTREKTVRVKEFLSELEGSVAAEEAALAAEERDLAEARRNPGGVPSSEGVPTPGGGQTPERWPPAAGAPPAVAPGVEVLAGEGRRRGTVLRADRRGAWIVEIGSLRMSFPEKDLVPLASAPEEQKPLIAPPDLNPESRAQLEVKLLGMRLEEALEVLRRQIDAAALSGLREFSVVHGKGDGILQRGVQEFLKTQELVEDYSFSRPELGGFGRTEVVLKK
jgi:DNA mismatch repair protein MutS2